MTRRLPTPSRALLDALSSGMKRPYCEQLYARAILCNHVYQRRAMSGVSALSSEMEVEGGTRPRWVQTPPAMKAPVPTKPRPADYKPFKTNSDPVRLDAVYSSLLGKDGEKMLSEETRWLAVTHKSFDHGRRGFNERLAYLGKRIVDLQTSLALLNSTNASKPSNESPDPHGRVPFQHPATANVEILSSPQRDHFGHHIPLSELAQKHGLQHVIRWQPKNPDHLLSSGCDMIYAQSLYAIVGAVALERGGAVANEVAKERILKPLGIKA